MNLSVSELSIRLGDKPSKKVLDKVSFKVHEGEFLSLLGASGAGKSTILKVIAGILLQDAGDVVFDGESVNTVPPHKRGVGFVFQDMRLFPHMNVRENVSFPCKMAGMPKRQRLERADYLLECVHLDGLGGRDIFSLSGGQQQRVALARALAAKPRILLLDEPFSGLDENLRDEMRSLVLRLHREFEITTIMVTHDAIEALEMSDRIVYVSEGAVVQEDIPKALYEHPLTHEIASCFGECSVINGVVEEGRFKRGSFECAAPQCEPGPAKAVVRYQGVCLQEDNTNPLKTKCSIFRGDDYLVRVDVAGETLSVPSSDEIESGTRVKLTLSPNSYFVYPVEQRDTHVK